MKMMNPIHHQTMKNKKKKQERDLILDSEEERDNNSNNDDDDFDQFKQLSPRQRQRQRKRHHRHPNTTTSSTSRTCHYYSLIVFGFLIIFSIIRVFGSFSDLKNIITVLGIFSKEENIYINNIDAANNGRSIEDEGDGDGSEVFNIPIHMNMTDSSMTTFYDYGEEKKKKKKAKKKKTKKIKTSTNSTTTNTNTTLRGNLYLCGWHHEGLALGLFPDYNYKGEYTSYTKSNKNDILVVGMFGPCPISKSRLSSGRNFRGIVLFVNGEPYGRIFNNNNTDKERIYRIGGSLPSISSNNKSELLQWPNNHIFRTVYYFNVILMNHYRDSLDLIFDPQKRPHGDAYYHYYHYLFDGNNNNNENESNNSNNNNIINTTTNVIITTNTTTTPSSSSSSSGAKCYNKMIYVASKCLNRRQHIAEVLSTIIPLDIGGKCTIENNKTLTINVNNNNNNKTIQTATTNTEITTIFRNTKWTTNWKLYSKYKYCLTLENSALEGYISEKILWGFFGGCLPIYYGTSEVLDIFHNDAFIYIADDDDNTTTKLDKVISKLIYLESNYTAYLEMLSQPVLKNGNDTINKYFSLSDNIGDGSLKRRMRSMMGI